MYEKLKPVGKRIQDARKAIGLTQADLADKLDISVSHMSSIETGRANFGVETLMKITEILKVSADSLLRTDIPDDRFKLVIAVIPTPNDIERKVYLGVCFKCHTVVIHIILRF